ncbi:MAG: aspartate carbamoyltransferase [Spirochaetia bacterium]|nr:aspartate carbamoyltransferase [Spirochaetia bacterium]
MVNRNKIHPLLIDPVTVRDGVRGIERPKSFMESVSEDPEVLKEISNHHIVSARQFSKETVVQLCRLAAHYETTPTLIHKPLSDKIMISAFSEPSTRTRFSFESAWSRLGGNVMSMTDPGTTGLAKGESMEDIAEMFSNYGDVMVLRSSDDEMIYSILEYLRIPVVNAGNGIDEHPTQALSDLYTILKWRPDLSFDSPESKIKIGIIGTPGKMRTVRSLLLLLSYFHSAIDEIIIINSEEGVFSEGQAEELKHSGLSLRIEKNLEQILPELDVIYINSIAWVGDTYETLAGNLKLHAASPLKKDAIILHPLARGPELDTSLDQTEHNWYFAQARGAVFLRMALLTCILQKIDQVADVQI